MGGRNIPYSVVSWSMLHLDLAIPMNTEDLFGRFGYSHVLREWRQINFQLANCPTFY
jgi:hypothetical protein